MTHIIFQWHLKTKWINIHPRRCTEILLLQETLRSIFHFHLQIFFNLNVNLKHNDLIANSINQCIKANPWGGIPLPTPSGGGNSLLYWGGNKHLWHSTQALSFPSNHTKRTGCLSPLFSRVVPGLFGQAVPDSQSLPRSLSWLPQVGLEFASRCSVSCSLIQQCLGWEV
jgi:hypothetical protein